MDPIVSDRALRDIKLAERERLLKLDQGILDSIYLLRPCRIKVLMLVDNSGGSLAISYNHTYFGLSEVLDTLRSNTPPWVRIDVTRAHRRIDQFKPPANDPAAPLYGPHLENFHFDQADFDINTFDEVWFYGFASGTSGAGACGPVSAIPPNALTDTELKILYQWMNEKQGGVFAVGDHYTLGEALCSRIPRVRNMRKWTLAQGVPTNYGLDRHDTLQPGHDISGTALDESHRYTFDDESDDIPMPIRLRWYSTAHSYWSAGSPGFPSFPKYRYPHPVMCGKDGPIRILPDHPHEGEVIVPTILTDTLSFCGYSAREYPDYSGGPLSPQIIAWARVRDDHDAASFKGMANALEFGAVGAYNGHAVSVGRVITDSTWHHWFNVNLSGRLNINSNLPEFSESGDARKLNGFNDSPAGQAAYDKIKNYHVNVALWLAPPGLQRRLARRACWTILQRFPLAADLNASMSAFEIGALGLPALARYIGPCGVRAWWPLFVSERVLAKLVNPKVLETTPELAREMDEFMLGGILKSMLEAQDKFPEGKHPEDAQLDDFALSGIKIGMQAFGQHVQGQARAQQALVRALNPG